MFRDEQRLRPVTLPSLASTFPSDVVASENEDNNLHSLPHLGDLFPGSSSTLTLPIRLSSAKPNLIRPKVESYSSEYHRLQGYHHHPINIDRSQITVSSSSHTRSIASVSLGDLAKKSLTKDDITSPHPLFSRHLESFFSGTAGSSPTTGSAHPLRLLGEAESSTIVNPSDPLNAGSTLCNTISNGVSFDVLRPDPFSASLVHVASSTTRWTAIPLLSSKAASLRLSQQSANKIQPPHPRILPQILTEDSIAPQEYVFRLSIPSSGSSRGPHADARARMISARAEVAQHDQAKFEREVRELAPYVPRGRRRLDQSGEKFVDGLHSSPGARCQVGSTPASSSRNLCMTLFESATSAQLSSVGNPSTTLKKPTPHIATSKSNNGSTTRPLRRRKPSDINRPHICPRCSKRFSRPSSLRVHGHVHTGLRPFNCPHPGCCRVFSVSSNMRRHMRSHLVGSERDLPVDVEGHVHHRAHSPTSGSSSRVTEDDDCSEHEEDMEEVERDGNNDSDNITDSSIPKF